MAQRAVSPLMDDWRLGIAALAGGGLKYLMDVWARAKRDRSTAARHDIDTLIGGFQSLADTLHAGFGSLAQEALAEATRAHELVAKLRDEMTVMQAELARCHATREQLGAEVDGLTQIVDRLRAQIEVA